MEEVHIIGIVRNGKFFPMDTENDVRVTETGITEATTPTAMNLGEYEGKVIMISGQDQGSNMIYAAKVEDVASPILSAIVLRIFNK